jgi:hypothetical protein
MTQEQLEAGADAVLEVANQHGVGSYLSRDQLREIAAAVYHAMVRKSVTSQQQVIMRWCESQ